MRIESLSYFVEIAECGSFNKAAEALYISQPSLSRTIQNLEDEIGYKLFDRSNRGIQLTEEGKKVFIYAKHLLEQMHSLEKYMTYNTYIHPVHLSISVCGLFLSGLLLNEFYTANQADKMEMLLNEVTLEQAMDQVSDLTSELGIVTVFDYQMSRFKRVADIKNIEVTEIGESPIMVHLGCLNPLYAMDEIPMDALKDCTQIRLPDDYFSHLSVLMEEGDGPCIRFEKCIVMNNVHTIISLISNSEAVYIGNRWSGKDLNTGRIHSLTITGCYHTQKLLLLKRKQEILTPAAASFLHSFLSTYGEKEGAGVIHE